MRCNSGGSGSGSGGVVDGAQVTATRVRALGRKALVAYADVSDVEAVDAMVQRAVAAMGHIDIVVTCAYYTKRQPFLETDTEGMRRTFEVTVFGTVHAVQRCAFAVCEDRAWKYD